MSEAGAGKGRGRGKECPLKQIFRFLPMCSIAKYEPRTVCLLVTAA